MSDLTVNLAGLLPVKRKLDRLSRVNTARLLDVLGSELESQTRRRIGEEKTGPDGVAWDPWTEAYAAQRAAKGGILELDGNLRDSITYEVGNDAVTVGSNLVYASVQQDGWDDKNIPARPYLGVSDENLDDLGGLVLEFIAKEIGA